MTRWLYRGATAGEMRRYIRDGDPIEGQAFTMAYGNPRGEIDGRLSEIETQEGGWTFQTEWAVGGVTDSLSATRRFRGNDDLVVVFDAQKLPFKKCSYSYEWMDEHPGALSHILTTVKGEIREPSGDLIATFEERPSGARIVENCCYDSLPATSEKSLFAGEQEWIAFQPEVDVQGAIEGVVSVTEKDSVAYRVTEDFADQEYTPHRGAEYYDMISEKLPGYAGALYLLVTEKNANPDRVSHENAVDAYGPSGRVDVESVPRRFRGWSSE